MSNDLDTFIAAYSDSFGYAYDNNIILNWYPRRIMALCTKEQSLLELGIGHGFSTNRFSQFFGEHTVIDGSASVIGQFKAQYPDNTAEIVESYFETFDTDKRFDLIVMGFVLEHVDDPQAVLQSSSTTWPRAGVASCSCPMVSPCIGGSVMPPGCSAT